MTAEAEVGAMPLLTVRTQEGAMSQGEWAALDSGIAKEKDSPLEPPERTQPS